MVDRAHWQVRDTAPRRRGFHLDLVIAIGVIMFAVFGVFAGLDARVFELDHADKSGSHRVLETACEELSRRSYDDVAALQGDIRKISGQGNPRFRVDLAVSQASLGLLEIRAVLVDRKLGRPVDQLTTYRARSR